MSVLSKACESEDDELARRALMEVVPTFRSPEEVNAVAIAETEDTEETLYQREPITA